MREVSKRPTRYQKYCIANKFIIIIIILIAALSSISYHYHIYHSTTIFYKKIKKVNDSKRYVVIKMQMIQNDMLEKQLKIKFELSVSFESTSSHENKIS